MTVLSFNLYICFLNIVKIKSLPWCPPTFSALFSVWYPGGGTEGGAASMLGGGLPITDAISFALARASFHHDGPEP